MKALNCMLVVLAISGAGCRQSTTPQLATVSGVVRYVDGTIVVQAKVSTDTGRCTFTDGQGRYSITVPVSAGGVTLTARDGFTPGVAYAVIHSGSIRVRVADRGARSDIVLDQAEII